MEEIERYDTFILPDPQEDTEDADADTIKVQETDGKRQLVGYPVVWGAISDVRRDGFRHRFQRGSIKWTTPTYALMGHEPNRPLSSTANATLTLAEDDYGVKATIDLDDTQEGIDTYKRVANRLIAGMSFGGKRLAYDRTDDPKVIDVSSFVAEEISLTILPGMTETNVVISPNAPDLEKQKAAAKQKMMRAALDKSSLTMLSAGRVSVSQRRI